MGAPTSPDTGTVGTVLPGGLRIDAIEKRDGRWVLVAGNLRLEQAPVPAQ